MTHSALRHYGVSKSIASCSVSNASDTTLQRRQCVSRISTQRFYRRMIVLSTAEILENVVRLVNVLDNVALRVVDDLPILELAKWLIFRRPG